MQKAFPWFSFWKAACVSQTCRLAFPKRVGVLIFGIGFQFYLRQHRILEAAIWGGYFTPIQQFVKPEVHAVFHVFTHLRLGQHLLPKILAPLCGAVLDHLSFCNVTIALNICCSIRDNCKIDFRICVTYGDSKIYGIIMRAVLFCIYCRVKQALFENLHIISA